VVFETDGFEFGDEHADAFARVEMNGEVFWRWSGVEMRGGVFGF